MRVCVFGNKKCWVVCLITVNIPHTHSQVVTPTTSIRHRYNSDMCLYIAGSERSMSARNKPKERELGEARFRTNIVAVCLKTMGLPMLLAWEYATQRKGSKYTPKTVPWSMILFLDVDLKLFYCKEEEICFCYSICFVFDCRHGVRFLEWIAIAEGGVACSLHNLMEQ